MHGRLLYALPALAALADHASAHNPHAWLHRRHLEKRILVTKVDVEMKTVCVVPDGNTVVPTPCPSDAVAPPPAPPAVTLAYAAQPLAPQPQTTMSTAVKPADQPPTPVQKDVGAAAPAPAPAPASAPEAPASAASFSLPGLADLVPGFDAFASADASSTAASKSTLLFGCKAGVVSNVSDHAKALTAQFKQGRGWQYNWAADSNGLDLDIPYVPMLWGDKPEKTGPFEQYMQTTKNQVKAILSFNEPDNPNQAHMTPEQAADAHALYLNKYARRAKIGTPAVTNGNGDFEGINWLEKFKTACDAKPGGCAYDFCAVHWYSELKYKGSLLTYLEKAHKVCDKPIWLTEFGLSEFLPIKPTDDQKKELLEYALPELEKLDYVQAYAYFLASPGSLLSSHVQDALGDLGNMYVKFAS